MDSKKTETIINDSTIISSKDVHLSDIVYVKNVIPLETNPNSLIGDFRKILKYAGKFYVSFNRTSLIVFDGQGNYLRKIGCVGNGPGEYTSISDFDVNKEGVFINSNKRILQYALDGTFLRDFPLEINMIGLNVTENRILGYVTSDEFVSHVFDRDVRPVNHHHPASPAAWTGTSSYYWPYGKDKYFAPLGSGNDILVYDVEKDKYSYSQFVNLPDMLTLDMENKLMEKEGKGVMLKEYARIVWPVNSNATHIFFGTQRNDEDDVLWIKDLKDDSSRAYFFNHIINDVSFTSVKGFFSAFTKSPDSFLAYVFPADLKQAISDTDKTDSPYYEEMRTLSEHLTEEDNMILIEYEIK